MKDGIQVELGQKGSEEEEAGARRKESLAFQVLSRYGLGLFGYMGALDRHFHSQTGSAGESGKPFFPKDALHGPHRDFRALLGEAFDDVAGGELMGAVGFDFLPGGGVDASAGGEAFGDGFGEIQFAGGEEVPEQADILGRVLEPLGDDPGWEAVDKGSTQGFIAALPIGDGVGEKGGIFHEKYYIIWRL